MIEYWLFSIYPSGSTVVAVKALGKLSFFVTSSSLSLIHLSSSLMEIFIPGYIDSQSKEMLMYFLCTGVQSSLYTVEVYSEMKCYVRGK